MIRARSLSHLSRVAIVVCALASAPIRAQLPERADDSALPSPASTIFMQISTLENDIAQLVQKRNGAAAPTLPWLEFQIDARIFARWLLAQAAGNTPMSSAQIGGFLHAQSMLALLPVVDDFASKQSAAPNSIQAVGLDRFHKFTFQLKDAKDLISVDSAAADVASDMQIVLTSMKDITRLPALVPMRPSAYPSSTQAKDHGPVQSGPKSIDELAALARQASVSPQLRRQLIAMAALAHRASATPDQQSEAQTLRAELEDALNLTAGLQANTAVSADERTTIESQLCDALALFSDPRLRAAGRERLSALDQYRRLLSRVGKISVPPEFNDAIAPALAWAHENPDQGDNVLSAVEKFVSLHQRHDTRPQEPEQLASFKPADTLRRAYDDLSKQFVSASTDFLTDATNIGRASRPIRNSTRDNGAANRANKADSTAGPNALAACADEMARLEDLLDVLLATPRTLNTLLAFKPRPTDGMAHRVNIIVYTLTSTIKSPARDEAARQLLDLQTLADLADRLSTQPDVSIPPSVIQAYGGDQISAVGTKWKAMVAEMASAFSANQSIDPSRLIRLKAISNLFDALYPAADLEAAFAKPDALTKWADWTIDPDQVHSLMFPYQQALSRAFTGCISDNSDALLTFSHLRPRYEPMMALFTRTGTYTDACSRLPDGFLGQLARLGTPYEKAPFGYQRFASFVAALAASSNGDSAAEDRAVTAISDRSSQ